MDGVAAVGQLVRPEWPPLRHVARGWAALGPAGQAEAAGRVEAILARHTWGNHRREALLPFFAFLAQVETIAIEIPLRALPQARGTQKDLLRRQLVDEVVHSLLFARLAHELALPAAAPPAPLPSAERLLERIRTEPDAAVAAALLNLVAEAWIETLFGHAARWGVADAAFAAVLADEARHVDEAHAHLGGLDRARAERALRDLERGLVEVGAEPSVALAMLELAGDEGYEALGRDLLAGHRRQLAEVGLEPGPLLAAGMPPPAPRPSEAARPQRVPDTPWREMARQVWSPPRDPTMQGAFQVRVGHVPRKLLTPVLVAAIGRAWAGEPRLNRVVLRDGVWQLPHANVGVRVLGGEDRLGTVVVPKADTLSVRDIQRLLADGASQLARQHPAAAPDGRPTGPAVPKAAAEALALLPPTELAFSVALSNPGRFGLESGAGAFTGPGSPSTDITVGQRQRRPAWAGVAYVPAWHVTFGCLQDHRVFDGREAGLAMSALRRQLSRAGVRRILRAPDVLPAERPDALPAADLPAGWEALPAQLRMLGTVGYWKVSPVVLGGAAVGVGLAAGAAGYAIARALQDRPDAPAPAGAGEASSGALPAEPAQGIQDPAAAAAAAAPGTPAGAAALAGMAAQAQPTPGGCRAVTMRGEFCRSRAADDGLFCRLHGGA